LLLRTYPPLLNMGDEVRINVEENESLVSSSSTNDEVKRADIALAAEEESLSGNQFTKYVFQDNLSQKLRLDKKKELSEFFQIKEGKS
jgi:fructose-specific phosphotransferase system component IIB